MRKSYAAVLALLLVFCMGTTVFAAGSITASDVSNGVSVTIGQMSTQNQSSVKTEVAKQDSNAKILGTVDVSAPGVSSKDLAKGLSLRINVKDVKAGDVVRVLHFTNGSWEVISPSTVGDGYVIATFYSLSPVAIVKYSSSVTAPAPTYQNTTNNPGNDDDSDDPNDQGQPSDPEDPDDSDDLDDFEDPDDDSGYPDDPDVPDDYDDAGGSSGTTGGNSGTNTNTKPGANTSTKPSVNTSAGSSGGSSVSTGSKANTSTSAGRSTSYATSPKTHDSMPVIPVIALFFVLGIVAFCGKKAKSL